jgi:hypothetical protein
MMTDKIKWVGEDNKQHPTVMGCLSKIANIIDSLNNNNRIQFKLNQSMADKMFEMEKRISRLERRK